MEVITYSKARQNLAQIMKTVNLDHMSYHVTNRSGDDVVVMSKTDFDSLQETMYLLSSPVNAGRLNDSILELNEGHGQEHDLVDL